jgi:hypothetical protein
MLSTTSETLQDQVKPFVEASSAGAKDETAA